MKHCVYLSKIMIIVCNKKYICHEIMVGTWCRGQNGQTWTQEYIININILLHKYLYNIIILYNKTND